MRPQKVASDALVSRLEAGMWPKAQRRSVLRGTAADSYIGLLLDLLRRGRPNRSFPDRDRLEHLFRALAPRGNHNLYDELELGARSGMPSERMVTRLQADQALAAKVCGDEEARDPRLREAPVIDSRPDEDLHLRRYRYHRSLVERPVQPSFSVRFELRKVQQAKSTTHLLVTLDRFDLSDELFARYTVHLAHTESGLRRSPLRLLGNRLEVSRNFENLIARATTHDSELALLRLGEIPSLTVEGVARCRIGPLYAAGMDGPAEFQSLLDEHPGELVLALPSDRTATDIDRDSSSDPFSQGYREFLAPELREMVEGRRKELGYRVRRQRKLVCTRGIAPALQAFLKQRSCPCLVYVLG